MRALYIVGFLFAVVTLWAVTTSPPQSNDSHVTITTGQGTPTQTNRSVAEKRAMAIAFVEKQMQEHPIPGLSLSVVYKNETVIAQGFGTKQFGKTNTPVTASTLFQIGSYTKTFIALGIAKLVDEGVMQWTDSVKQHLPWFELIDKYAEKYTTIGDLLAMNSVFGSHEGDQVWAFGVYSTEKELVQHLRLFNTSSRSLRPGYAYSNLNFEILGQVLVQVTNQSWFGYIQTTILHPLGMNETFGEAMVAPNQGDVSHGHLTCGGNIIGPFSLFEPSMIVVARANSYFASGSIVMSTSDLAKLSHFLLDKGHGIFRSPKTIEDMTTGHSVLTLSKVAVESHGFTFNADGNVVAAGYGLDVVGNVMFGHDYYEKGGDTMGFKLRNGFVPSEGLAVTVTTNVEYSELAPTAERLVLERMRSYLLGIFLDVPLPYLDATHLRATAHLPPPVPGRCDPHYFGGQPWGPPGASIPAIVQDKLVGTYVMAESPAYYGNFTVFKNESSLVLRWGAYSKPLVPTADPATVVWAVELSAVTLPVGVEGMNTSSPTLLFGGAPLVRIA
ncbi:Aste57867_9764 [Aphanomyces stellatus]|uniref:Aste57867_9764 protein n=1 Tax=Aphanomyces stellatus TaxID=120398 RepID=A0A485KPC6_9STRA|nr:hypothetical protein As57867_009725 [Aphanomyces stellatus]VFT86643.1 Aste57867_9764 [Aphanomyces stellatus]